MTQPTTDYVKEWLTDGQILCYRFPNVGHDAMDAWFADISGELNQWPAEKKLRLIYDVRPVGINTYALNRARQISNLRPDVSGRTAIIANLSNHLVTQLIGVTIRSLSNRSRQRSVFSDEDTAVAWLLESDKI